MTGPSGEPRDCRARWGVVSAGKSPHHTDLIRLSGSGLSRNFFHSSSADGGGSRRGVSDLDFPGAVTIWGWAEVSEVFLELEGI